jgi:hypothetical protein
LFRQFSTRTTDTFIALMPTHSNALPIGLSVYSNAWDSRPIQIRPKLWPVRLTLPLHEYVHPFTNAVWVTTPNTTPTVNANDNKLNVTSAMTRYKPDLYLNMSKSYTELIPLR